MRHLALALVASAVLVPRSSLAQGREAMPSGRGTTQVTLADPRQDATDRLPPLTITLDYGQPHLRGRSLHTGDLVPFDSLWRTGANSATTFNTGVDLSLGGASVPKGHYFVWTLPTRTGWTLILQRDAGQEPLRYNATHDAARVDLRVRQLPMAIESLTMWLIPSRERGAPKGELRILWGTVELTTDWVVRQAP